MLDIGFDVVPVSRMRAKLKYCRSSNLFIRDRKPYVQIFSCPLYAETQYLSDIFSIRVTRIGGYGIVETVNLPIREYGWEDGW